MTRALVIGVRGHTGSQLAPILVSRGDVQVRGTARDPETIAIDGVEPVRFVWEDRSTWSDALNGGSEVMYIVRPEIGDAAEHIGELVAAAKGVRKVVLLSEMAADLAPPDDWVVPIERAVMDGGIPWTIVRPASFFQLLVDPNYLLGGIRERGQIEWPSEGAHNAFVDAYDIAAVVAEALLTEGHDGKAYTVTGPESLTFAEVADKLEAVVGYPVEHVDTSLRATIDEWAGAGLEPWLLDYLRAVLGRVISGGFAPVSDDVERVTGRAPRDIETFFRERASVWSR